MIIVPYVPDSSLRVTDILLINYQNYMQLSCVTISLIIPGIYLKQTPATYYTVTDAFGLISLHTG